MPTGHTFDRETRTGVPHSWHAAVLCVLAGSALFILAYPPWNLGTATAWIALIPLMAASAGAPPTRAVLLGWSFGLLTHLGVFSWITQVPGLRWYHIALLDGYLALYPAIWCLLAARWLTGALWTQASLACAWVVLEYLRGHAGFLALPWITLAQSQVDNLPLLQTASLFGESAVTFLVVLGNLAIWNVLQRERSRTAFWCAIPVLMSLGYGINCLASWEAGDQTLSVATLNTGFPAPEAARPDPLVRVQAQLEHLRQQFPAGADLLTLPESAIINPQLFPDHLDELRRLVDEHESVVIAGVAEATKFDRPVLHSGEAKAQLRSEAWIITPEQAEPRRHVKSRLVPFAERTPLKGWLAWPAWLVPQKPEVEEGPQPQSYLLSNHVRVGIMICWESLFADHAMTLVRDQANLLLMLSNEGWFGATAAGAQHNLTARIRAVETHRAVVVASNMGPSLIIDPFGRELASHSSPDGIQWVNAEVPIVTELSLYARLGEIFVLSCGMIVLARVLSFLGMRNSPVAVFSDVTVRQRLGL